MLNRRGLLTTARLIVRAVFFFVVTSVLCITRGIASDTLGLPPPIATSQWAVRLVVGEDPARVASELGARSVRRVGRLENTYLLDIPDSARETGRISADTRLRGNVAVRWIEQQVARQQQKRLPTDPNFASQWHLNNVGQSGGAAGQDANVVSAWSQGYLGTGIVIGVVDDGLQYAHPDILPNYRGDLSWDFDFDDADPAPDVATDFHGTSVAGVAVARDDGSSCGVGAAYRAQVAGLRLIAAASTDAMEAEALSHAYDTIAIYSNSWGPTDDGKRLEGPGSLTQAAIVDAIEHGRGGLGSIYVWAGGNGAQDHDNINYDGYANSRYVNAIGAITDIGYQAPYSEPGAPLIVVAPSSGELTGITTTDLMGANGYNQSAGLIGDCTNTFGGTSSAAPLVAGVAALMLDANPNLGWRDVKHILLSTATITDANNSDWISNGSGRMVNHAYGYGRVNAAYATVAAHARIRNLAPEKAFESRIIEVNAPIPDSSAFGVLSSVTVPPGLVVEHVEVMVSAAHPYRGDLNVTLTAPSGTTSTLATTHSDANSDYVNWRFSSIRHWGETSGGDWVLRVVDGAPEDVGTFQHWQLLIYGRTPRFADVGSTHWAWRSIEALNQAGITDGCAPENYCPESTVSRAQAAVFLERAIHGGKYVPPSCTGNVFGDVASGTFACSWIEQLFTEGLSKGCQPGLFCPSEALTRTQVALLLLRAKHGTTYEPPPCTGSIFSDVTTTTYACSWIEQMAREGMTKGCNATSFCPDRNVSRGEMATFLARAFRLVEP